MHLKKAMILIVMSVLVFSACTTIENQEIKTIDIKAIEEVPEKDDLKEKVEVSKKTEDLLNSSGDTIETRYSPPSGYSRVSVAPGSYEEFLRNQKLKPYGSPVLYHSGREKNKPDVYDSVLQVDIGDRDLHQCADAIMLLRAEYLYSQERYDEIRFHFVSGFLTEFSKWAAGNRIDPDTGYYPGGSPGDYSYENFREYMDMVFAYAGTLSMLEEATPIDPDDVQIGDIFLDRGHTVIIMDMAENEDGEKLFIVAQSYMPAQETQVLINRGQPEISPWYSLNHLKETRTIKTPEWGFKIGDLMRFREIAAD